MTLAAHPDILKEKPELIHKVALVFTEAQKILKSDPKRGKALMAKEYPSMAPETNNQAYETVSQIWTKDGHMTEAQARADLRLFAADRPGAGRFPVDLH